LKIFIVFGVILVLNKLRLHLSLSLFTGALILGLWMGMTPLALIESAARSGTRTQTIGLFLIVGLIMVMSRIMEESGHMTRLVKSFARLSRNPKTVGSVMSALIGLLPMPGGALFSAPMVEASLSRSPATNEQKTALNYWFRHIWEYWWPLYPGVILAVALLEVETWSFMVTMVPMTILSVTAGILFILLPIEKSVDNHGDGISRAGVRQFIWEMMPILVVILLILCLRGVCTIIEWMGYPVEIPSFLLILIGLILSLVWVCLVNHTSLHQLRSAIFRKDNLIMLILIVVIMIFKGIMEDSQAVTHIRNDLITYGIPAILLILIMPFLSGFILGIAIGFVGASFPLIIPLFQSPHLVDYLSSAGLAYTFGYIGMMLSPVHLCLLVTKDFFKADFLGSYRYLIKPAVAILISASLLFLIARTF
jgi:integral membrane protein (TIGR00529 family)